MKLPKAFASVSMYDNAYERPYPPLGFCPFAEHELGNGDQFGLYWPIGREDRDPIVAETHHDEWSVKPRFSSLDRFLEAAANSGDDDDDEDSLIGTPSIDEDPQSTTNLASKAEALAWLQQRFDTISADPAPAARSD